MGPYAGRSNRECILVLEFMRQTWRVLKLPGCVRSTVAVAIVFAAFATSGHPGQPLPARASVAIRAKYWSLPTLSAAPGRLGFIPGSYCVAGVTAWPQIISGGRTLPPGYIETGALTLAGRRSFTTSGLGLSGRVVVHYDISAKVDRRAINPYIELADHTAFLWIGTGPLRRPAASLFQTILVDAFGRTVARPALAAQFSVTMHGRGRQESMDAALRLPCPAVWQPSNGRVLGIQVRFGSLTISVASRGGHAVTAEPWLTTPASRYTRIR